MIGLFIFAFVALGGFLFAQYLGMKSNVDVQEEEAKGFMIGGIVCWAFAAIFACVVWCSWQRVRFAAMIIKATAQYITDVKRIYFVPIFSFVLLLIYLAWWIVSGAYLISVGELKHDPGSPIGTIEADDLTKAFKAFYYFFGIWTLFFISNWESFVLTAVCCLWYFAGDRRSLGGPVCLAMAWASWSHFGTIAFGSLILTIIYIIKQILEHMRQAAESEARQGGEGAAGAALLLGCITCLVGCFEQCAKYITKHAYIETTLWNSNFCVGCKDAIKIVASNFWRVGTLHGITDLAVMFGVFLIAALTTIVGFVLLKSVEMFTSLVFETLWPLLIVFIIGLCCAMYFLSVFEVSADALIHCAIVDEMVNGQPLHLYAPIKEAVREMPMVNNTGNGGYGNMGGGNQGGYEMMNYR
jgi:hypothetical protein